ncbi:DHA1 family tetracycline resistance protein-like MFS transporter [Rhizobium sp. BK196]|nr:DHA1 family tetracycline resistance protein-like MFS transporter [Rhizobium sp. BK196]
MNKPGMNKPLLVIFAAICLDAVGIGLIFPILPRLLQDVMQTRDIAFDVGLMTALYAAMQFVFSPVLGALSDTIGRRPVLLISLAGAAINYVIMSFAPSLLLLLIGRAIAGLTSANMSVASAYITDISPADQRARRFGLSNAMFGAGFIIGPVLGGLLGDYWLRLPFIAAAALNACNLLLALLVLPESRIRVSRMPSRRKIDLAALNPLRPLKRIASMKGLLPIVSVYFVFSAAGESYGTCWALWSFDTFGWNGASIGLSLGAFGICQTVCQAFLPGPATRLLGERWSVITGIAAAVIALAVMAFANQGWMIFAIMPVFTLIGIGNPAFQALATRQVEPDRQGELQGVLASTVSLASIVAPLAFSSFYFVVRANWPGGIWLSVIALYAIAVPLVFLSTRTGETGEAATA